jgi:hypothetical protein
LTAEGPSGPEVGPGQRPLPHHDRSDHGQPHPRAALGLSCPDPTRTPPPDLPGRRSRQRTQGPRQDRCGDPRARRRRSRTSHASTHAATDHKAPRGVSRSAGGSRRMALDVRPQRSPTGSPG